MLSPQDEAAVKETLAAGAAYVDRLIVCLEARFPKDTQKIIVAMSKLFPAEICKATHVPTFGLDVVKLLGIMYLPNVESHELITQYNSFKYFAIASLRNVGADQLLKIVCHNAHIIKCHPNIIVLIKIAATLAHGSVDCERAFSLQNNIKTEERSVMSAKQLNSLMVCARDGPQLRYFNTESNLKRWKSVKKQKYICS